MSYVVTDQDITDLGVKFVPRVYDDCDTRIPPHYMCKSGIGKLY